MGQEVAMRLGAVGVARMSGVQEDIGSSGAKVWSRGHGVRRSNSGGSGGRCDFRSPRGGQGVLGSGDLVQVVQEVIRISGT